MQSRQKQIEGDEVTLLAAVLACVISKGSNPAACSLSDPHAAGD